MTRLSLTSGTTESLRATLLRNVPVALVVATIVTLAVRGMPASEGDWKGWLARFGAALWITVGGHFVELFYLRRVLPRLVAEGEPGGSLRWFMRLGARCGVWAAGGAVLWLGGMATYLLIKDGRLPMASELPGIAARGAVGFIGIELLGVHVILTILKRPSVWWRRDGRWG